MDGCVFVCLMAKNPNKRTEQSAEYGCDIKNDFVTQNGLVRVTGSNCR